MMLISILIYFLLVLILIYVYNNRNMVKLRGEDGFFYYVRKEVDNIIALKTLTLLRRKLIELINYIDNKMEQSNHEYKNYIKRIKQKLPNVQIRETPSNSSYTSYSVNKGEELNLCIRSKITKKFHSINELLYVAIHEIAHIGCPEIGHTKLFYDINKFLLKEAMEYNIYNYVNYNARPMEYCGIQLNHTILYK